jgi:hypothetical protein
MKDVSHVVLGLAVLILATALVEAQVSEPENQPKMKKRRWFGLRKALPEDVKQETFEIPWLMIFITSLTIAGVGASLIAKKAEKKFQVIFFN